MGWLNHLIFLFSLPLFSIVTGGTSRYSNFPLPVMLTDTHVLCWRKCFRIMRCDQFDTYVYLINKLHGLTWHWLIVTLFFYVRSHSAGYKMNFTSRYSTVFKPISTVILKPNFLKLYSYNTIDIFTRTIF